MDVSLLELLFMPLAMVLSSAQGVSVVEVDATELKILDYDAVIDVRNLDEYEGTTSADNCTIGKADPKGCLYGHLPGALWMPQLHLCGGTTPGVTCTDEVQQVADVQVLVGHKPDSQKDWPQALYPCAPLRLAFICHSGVRGLSAARNYANLLTATYDKNSSSHIVEKVVSVAGGTRKWYNAGRPTVFSAKPGGPKQCSQMTHPTVPATSAINRLTEILGMQVGYADWILV